jgi:hypothetical protein
MNVWIIGGYGSLGLLVLFLTSSYRGGISNLQALGYFGSWGFEDPSILILTLFLLGVSGASFYKGMKETNKKK